MEEMGQGDKGSVSIQKQENVLKSEVLVLTSVLFRTIL